MEGGPGAGADPSAQSTRDACCVGAELVLPWEEGSETRQGLSSPTDALCLGCGNKMRVAVARGLDGGCGCAGPSATVDIWFAAREGDLGEVQRLVGHDQGLLTAQPYGGWGPTPLTLASKEGHVEVVRWLLDQGAALDSQTYGGTALYTACERRHTPVVRMLLERGANPRTACPEGRTPLTTAIRGRYLEGVRLTLGHLRGKAAVNRRDQYGQTALWDASFYGLGGIVWALLESGADPTIADHHGTTPTATAKKTAPLPCGVTAEGRQECVALLEVRSLSCLPPRNRLSLQPD
jgi:hypothetical protein